MTPITNKALGGAATEKLHVGGGSFHSAEASPPRKEVSQSKTPSPVPTVGSSHHGSPLTTSPPHQHSQLNAMEKSSSWHGSFEMAGAPAAVQTRGGQSLPASSVSVKTEEKRAVAIHTKTIKKRGGFSKSSSMTSLDGSEVSLDDNIDEGNITARRQKRLERNRESARLSRRRRKQYLEVLEEKVAQLSLDMDLGRRNHASEAIPIIRRLRRQMLDSGSADRGVMSFLDTSLSRSSRELCVVATFWTQQLKCFAFPSHAKFILWLTLQNDSFFRGGRAISERLSAARIGERLLHSGHEKVSPTNAMWPLVCNEIGLSYEQEERVRTFQKGIIQVNSTWLDRHTGRSSDLVLGSLLNAVHAIAQKVGTAEHCHRQVLNASQRTSLLRWTSENSDRIGKVLNARRSQGQTENNKKRSFVPRPREYRDAANLYILNHDLQKAATMTPTMEGIASKSELKRLLRRPLFESLAQNSKEITQENSEESLSSAMKSGAAQQIVAPFDEEKRQVSAENVESGISQQVTPAEGQACAVRYVESALGFIKEIIPSTKPKLYPVGVAATACTQLATQADAPRRPQSQYLAEGFHGQLDGSNSGHDPPYAGHAVGGIPIQESRFIPSTVSSAPEPFQGAASANQQTYMLPDRVPGINRHDFTTRPMHTEALYGGATETTSAQQPAQGSFLPPHLGMVPEEAFPNGEGNAEDFFISLMEDEDADWAIGEGIGVDTMDVSRVT